MSNLIFDIDGTLRNIGKNPDIDPLLRHYLVISSKINKNYIVTGRTYANFLNFINEIESSVNIFKSVFCEDGHICYSQKETRLLITDEAKRQVLNIRQFIKKFINSSENKYYVTYPEKHLIGEVVTVIQEVENRPSIVRYLNNYIKVNRLTELKINKLTHHRLSVSVFDIDKYSAISSQNINLSDSYYFCDDLNDLNLAQHITSANGKIICPSNAIDELKKISTFVSNKPGSYGVVDFLSRNI